MPECGLYANGSPHMADDVDVNESLAFETSSL